MRRKYDAAALPCTGKSVRFVEEGERDPIWYVRGRLRTELQVRAVTDETRTSLPPPLDAGSALRQIPVVSIPGILFLRGGEIHSM